MQIDLNSLERRMIYIALTLKQGCFREYIEDPKTPASYRKTWRGLREKLVRDEGLHEELKSSMGEEKKIII